jgi:hypothetical protein
MHATTTRLGPCTGIHLESRTHHNVSEKGDGSPDQRLVRSASTLPVPKCTGDAYRRFSALLGGRELDEAAIRFPERPASPYSTRYEFCRRDNNEYIRG